MKQMRYRLLAAIVVLLLTAGCWDKAQKPHSARQNLLRVGTHSEPLDLDPQVVTSVPDQKVLRALFEGLVTPHPATMVPEPAVAQLWEISADGLTYTFHFRDNARWTNGDKVTADDFVFSYERLLNPELASENASLLYVLAGAEAYNNGATSDFSTVGIRAINPSTLELQLEAPTPYFLSLLTHHALCPVHPPTIKEHGAETRRGTAWTRAAHHVSNGPFRLAIWKHDDFIEVEKNPHYWEAEKVKLSGIRFIPIADASTEERSFRAGQMDITDSVPKEKVQSYLAKSSPLFISHPYLATYYYILNTTHPPLDDIRVRQALNLAIDRERLATQVVKCGQAPAFHFTPPDTNGYTSIHRIPQDIARAQELLAEAGYPKGKGLPPTELLFNLSVANKPIAEAIQRMWQEHLGITITLTSIEWKAYLARRRERNFDIARASWIADYIDPNTFLEVFTSTSSNNYTGWQNPRYDALLKQAAQTNSQAKRYDYLQQAEQILLTELPIIPIYFHNSRVLIRPEVQGYSPNLIDWHPYKYISLDLAN